MSMNNAMTMWGKEKVVHSSCGGRYRSGEEEDLEDLWDDLAEDVWERWWDGP